MNRRALQPVDGTYAQSHEVSGVTRFLFISGQVPAAEDGSVPLISDRSVVWHGAMSRRSSTPPG